MRLAQSRATSQYEGLQDMPIPYPYFVEHQAPTSFLAFDPKSLPETRAVLGLRVCLLRPSITCGGKHLV